MNQLAVAQPNQVRPLDPGAIEALILNGDLSKMTQPQKIAYYNHMCDMLSISAASKPFDYLVLNNKHVLYANKGCAEQLRSVHKIGLKIVDKQKIDDVYIVTAEALAPNGRTDSATGAVNVAGLKGEMLANAMMKAETKAKRRVTLSICGLNMLDETEVETIPGAHRTPIHVDQPTEEETKQAQLVNGYTIPFGKFSRRSLEEVGPNELAGYVDYIEKKAAKDNKPIQGQVKEFIDRASEFIASFENGKQDYDTEQSFKKFHRDEVGFIE